MRAVHDILYDIAPGKAPGPCAFIQHGKESEDEGAKGGEGLEYECVCPWCALSVGDRIDGARVPDYATLLHTLKQLMKAHMPFCTASGARLRVYITKVPLNVAEPPKVV